MASSYHQLRATRVFMESMFANPSDVFNVVETYQKVSKLSGFSVQELTGKSRKDSLVQYKFAALAALYVTSTMPQGDLARKITPDRSMLTHSKDMVSSWIKKFSLDAMSTIPLDTTKPNFTITPYSILQAERPSKESHTTDYPYERGTLIYHLAKAQNPNTPQKALQFVCQLSGFEPKVFWREKRDGWHVGHRNALYALLHDLQLDNTHTFEQLVPFAGDKNRASLFYGSKKINRGLIPEDVQNLARRIPNTGTITEVLDSTDRTVVPTCHYSFSLNNRKPNVGDIIQDGREFYVTIGTAKKDINTRIGGRNVRHPNGTLLAQQIIPFVYNGPKIVSLSKEENIIGGIDVLNPHTVAEPKIHLKEGGKILHQGAAFIIGAQVQKNQGMSKMKQPKKGVDVEVTVEPKTLTQVDFPF